MTQDNDDINRGLYNMVRGRQLQNHALLFGSKEQQQQQPITSTGQPVPVGSGPGPREGENAAMNRHILRAMGYPAPGDR